MQVCLPDAISLTYTRAYIQHYIYIQVHLHMHSLTAQTLNVSKIYCNTRRAKTDMHILYQTHTRSPT